MIKPWSFEFCHSLTGPDALDPKRVQAHFQWYLDLWTRDEALGFEGIFFSEHHFGSAYSPSPNLLVAHMATRTRRIRLGTLGTVAAYSSPWRVVEEIGMLDHLTEGRLEIGVVKGIPPEMAAVSISVQDAEERYMEVLDVLDQALAGKVVTHRGKHWTLEGLRLVPGCLQQPAPPKWISAMSLGTTQLAGRRGWKLCSGFLSAEAIGDLFGAYRAAAAEAGHAHDQNQLGIRRRIAFVDHESDVPEARRRAREVDAAAMDAMTSVSPKRILDSPPPHLSMVHDDEFIIGTPRQVSEEIIRQCCITGAGHFVAGLDGLRGWEEIARTHELFGHEVIPVLRQANVA